MTNNADLPRLQFHDDWAGTGRVLDIDAARRTRIGLQLHCSSQSIHGAETGTLDPPSASELQWCK